MVDMRYSVAGLQQSAAGRQDVAAGAEDVLTALLGLALPAGALGTVPSAAGFAEGLNRARLGIGRSVAAEGANRIDRAQRSTATAQLGGRLTADTTRLAQQASTGPGISDRMR